MFENLCTLELYFWGRIIIIVITSLGILLISKLSKIPPWESFKNAAMYPTDDAHGVCRFDNPKSYIARTQKKFETFARSPVQLQRLIFK